MPITKANFKRIQRMCEAFGNGSRRYSARHLKDLVNDGCDFLGVSNRSIINDIDLMRSMGFDVIMVRDGRNRYYKCDCSNPAKEVIIFIQQQKIDELQAQINYFIALTH